MTFVVVSDDPAVVDEMTYGTPAGVKILHEADARGAWRRMASIRPDAVVVDLQTGSSGGFALARDMAASPRLAAVPVVILLERDHDAWLARQAGAALHRTKPVTPDLVDDVLSLATS